MDSHGDDALQAQQRVLFRRTENLLERLSKLDPAHRTKEHMEGADVNMKDHHEEGSGDVEGHDTAPTVDPIDTSQPSRILDTPEANGPVPDCGPGPTVAHSVTPQPSHKLDSTSPTATVPPVLDCSPGPTLDHIVTPQPSHGLNSTSPTITVPQATAAPSHGVHMTV
jgi:hypothetical protein